MFINAYSCNRYCTKSFLDYFISFSQTPPANRYYLLYRWTCLNTGSKLTCLKCHSWWFPEPRLFIYLLLQFSLFSPSPSCLYFIFNIFILHLSCAFGFSPFFHWKIFKLVCKFYSMLPFSHFLHTPIHCKMAFTVNSLS